MESQIKNIDARCWTQRNIADSLRDSVSSERLGYTYIPLGKAANTEIKRLLWQIEHEKNFPHQVPEDYFGVHINPWGEASKVAQSPWNHYTRAGLRDLVSDVKNKFSFSVVRNPYIKLLSGYLDKVVSVQKIVDEEQRKRETERYSLPTLPASFEEFVDIVSSQSDRDADIHWTGQCFRLMYEFLPIKWVGHFEDLASVFLMLSQIFQVKVPQPRNNAVHATSATKKYAEHLTPPVMKRIKQRYEQDFELLGYSQTFDPEHLGPIKAPAKAGQFVEISDSLVELLYSLKREEEFAGRSAVQDILKTCEERGLELNLSPEIQQLIEGGR